MKYIYLIFILFWSNTYSQNQEEKDFFNALYKYENTDGLLDIENVEERIEFEKTLTDSLERKFEKLIVNDRITNYTIEKLHQRKDTIYSHLTRYESEKKEFILYSFPIHLYHLNYVLQKTNNKNKYKILLKDNKSNTFFTEIHTLNDKEFLLIEQMNEMVYSCNYAYVFQKIKNIYKKKKAFKNKTQLTICNFTEIDNSTSEKPDHYSLSARKISFDYKNKIISYGSCRNSSTGKTTIGKTSYKGGKFNISDCDERKDFD
ncbi:hypothetical protein [uncultured Flavobacterium sp.]|uniref:hypothetical protein n=1 Tax=uncultured Flavobacterium sp. TaxID=165435 RepID=UPI0025DEA6D8|nr:hypothetical protein [uncultured Flavobacterium sp.]